MTVRISRELSVPAPPERVWEFISNPDNRAAAISVVKDWEQSDDGGTIWHVKLPIPFVSRTVQVRTKDRERTEPEKVAFVGRSKVFRVHGEHELEATDEGTRLVSRFVVDGKAPGVESFFKGRLDDELTNLENALLDWLEREGTVEDAAAIAEERSDGSTDGAVEGR